METHVKRFGVITAYVTGEDAVGGSDLSLDWGGRLQVAYFDEGRADGNSILDIEED